jgi:hypothetical protein
MKIFIPLLIFVLAAGSISTSFAQNETEKTIKEYSPKLQIEHVIEKAKGYAAAEGQKLENYFIESIEYDADEKEWTIVFRGKLPVPGSHFIITIEDRTEKARLMPGK